jgi:hypothetical protein
MAIYIEPEQEQLFITLQAAARSRPRDQREEFMFLRSAQADHVRGNGLMLDVLYEDVIALDDADLIRVTGRHSRGSGFNFVIPPAASARFDEHKSGDNLRARSESGQSGSEHRQTEADPKAVMVVHGRNSAARDAMFAFIQRLGLKPLDWNELIAGTGTAAPYVGEVLDHAFSTATAVLVLFTPDDEARLRDEFHHPDDDSYERDLTPQARPKCCSKQAWRWPGTRHARSSLSSDACAPSAISMAVM